MIIKVDCPRWLNNSRDTRARFWLVQRVSYMIRWISNLLFFKFVIFKPFNITWFVFEIHRPLDSIVLADLLFWNTSTVGPYCSWSNWNKTAIKIVIKLPSVNFCRCSITCPSLNTYTNTHIQTPIHAHKHTHTHKNTHMSTHKNIHNLHKTHTNTYIHTHTNIR